MTEIKLRSRDWFENHDPDLTVLYLERFMNYGLTRAELQSGAPIIGIAQTGSDISPCNRHHIGLADRVREGIREAGGVAFEFPMHPIQESCRRPTASLDRNLAYLSLVEVLHGFPLDGVVLTTGCDKTAPAALMAVSTMDIPAIVLSGGPMLNGWYRGERIGSGTILFKARKLFASGEIDQEEYWRIVESSAPSIGHCNTMGTASTMNALAEALGMSLTGCAAIPAAYQGRAVMAYETGKRIVEMVREDLRPSRIMTKEAFENAIAVNSAIGGSTNAPIHINAIARHIGVEITMDDWQRVGSDIPVIVNMQPAGEYLGEEFHRAGGVPAVMHDLLTAGLLHPQVLTVTGKTMGENCAATVSTDRDVIGQIDMETARGGGLVVLAGNFFETAIIKTSVISDEFRQRYLENPAHPGVFEGRAVVFDGPEDYVKRIDDPSLDITEDSILVMRGVGAVGYPGSGEVVSMRPPTRLITQGVTALPCIGDGRQSGTSASPSILGITPEAAMGGDIALIRDGDGLRLDLQRRRLDLQVSESELAERRQQLAKAGGYAYPASQTPWQHFYRQTVSSLPEGLVMQEAVSFQRVDEKRGLPRVNL